MKKAISFSICLLLLFPVTQAQEIKEDPYSLGMEYYLGITRNYDPVLARNYFMEAATQGQKDAMIRLGELYSNARTGFRNGDSAVYWYTLAANSGEKRAWFLLGRLYQMGRIANQDFQTAASYYKTGVASGEKYATNALGYLHYKGLGVAQDYSQAFQLFEQSARSGLGNSMYFLGICYRNGYGTAASDEMGKYWLRKSVEAGEQIALHELHKEPFPENMSVISNQLQQQLKSLQNYAEKFTANSKNNYEGNYEGVAAYYDWSGRFISEILPLKLSLIKTASGYAGKWQEGENEPADIAMDVKNNDFAFHHGSSYMRQDHYSGRKEEKWQFNSAKLNLSFIQDSIRLNGFVQFYSSARREPGKPLQIILKRKIEFNPALTVGPIDFTVLPNPSSTHAVVQFTLNKSTRVALKVFTQNGILMYSENQKLLPSGTYNFNIPTNKLPRGAYVVNLSTDQQSTSKQLIRQ